MQRLFDLLETQGCHPRYERKFYVDQMTPQDMDLYLRTHENNFRPIYFPRYVNNFYFDGLAHEAYRANILGSTMRFKTRIRWYGDLLEKILDPCLEIKIKNSFLGYKLRYQLESFPWKTNLYNAFIKDLVGRSSAPEFVKEIFKSFRFSLMNRYRRKYYLSFDRKFRVTIDDKLEYSPFHSSRNGFSSRIHDRSGLVLELKYSQADEPQAAAITQSFPFRMTRMSKYVAGIEHALA